MTPESIAEAFAGATGCALGSQKCSGVEALPSIRSQEGQEQKLRCAGVGCKSLKYGSVNDEGTDVLLAVDREGRTALGQDAGALRPAR